MTSLQIAILRAVHKLEPDAYGVLIRRELERSLSKFVSYGSMYLAIDRLEKEGLVSSWHGDRTPERGNRPKRYVVLTPAGERAFAALASESVSEPGVNETF